MERYITPGLEDSIVLFILYKLIERFNTIAIKVPVGIFVDINELIIIFIWKLKVARELKQLKGRAAVKMVAV